MTSDVKRFAILIYDDVEPIDLGATYGVLSIARRVIPSIDMYLVAEEPGPVRLTGGLVVEAQHGYRDCPEADVVVVTGGPGWQQQQRNEATLNFIRHMADRSTIASVCTGGVIVAATGLLDGMRATTRRCGVAEEKTPLRVMGEQYSRVEAVEALVIDNGAVVTGGGVTLGIDTMLHLLERLFGAAKAAEVARLLEYSRCREANREALRSYRVHDGIA